MSLDFANIKPEQIAVLIPTLDEEPHIEQVITDLLADDPIVQKCQILVADGGSKDNTRAIVERMSESIPNLRLLDNPKRTQAEAMNLLTAGEFQDLAICVRCDAHASYPARYVSGLIDCMKENGATSVVVPMDAIADSKNCFQRGLAWIADSSLGAGGSPHRGGTKSGYVEHGHHAAFRMAEFRSLGGYDTAFVANEDAEYDRRLTESGGSIWLSSDHRIGYYPRKSADKLWKQYYNYGVGRAQTCLKHGIWPRMRQMIPVFHTLLFVVSLILLPVSWIFLAWPLFYAAVVFLAGAMSARKHGSLCGFAGSLALAIMHLAWGLGFLRQLVTKVIT